MARKVLTGAATPVACGYLDANGDWQPVVLTAGGVWVYSIDQTTYGTTNRVVTGQKRITLIQTPNISAAAIYASGDALGGKLIFVNAVNAGILTGVIEKVVLVDRDNERSSIDLVLFDRDFTATADNAAFDPSDADLANCIGHIAVTSGAYSAFNDNSEATVLDQPMPMVLNGTPLCGQLVVRGTPTYTAISDISVRLTIALD